LYLHNFKHEKYVGSDTPKNYEAVIRLIDPERNEDRDGVRIFMNEPLWYRGETFYQSSFLPGDKGTILQVVKNPGYQLPYLSCTMISFGLLVHFGMSLVRFLVRREAS
jgi:cytochrome c biogenesis protein ResB